MGKDLRTLLIAVATLLSTPYVHAFDLFSPDAVAVEGGVDQRNQHRTSAYRVGGALVWDWGVKWFPFHGWYLGGQWEANVGYWNGESGRTGVDQLYDFGITPVFRVQTDDRILGVYPFVEGAIGAHIFSETEFGDRQFGINYSFGDHLGAGVRFGDHGQYELNYRFQHLSNAGLGKYNSGINFHVFRLVYHFR